MSEPESLREFGARMKVSLKNRQEFPPEELAKYAGKWIAWSPDGSDILASSAESGDAVYAQLEAAGHDCSRCCISYVPAEGEVIVGPMSIMTSPSPNGDGTDL